MMTPGHAMERREVQAVAARPVTDPRVLDAAIVAVYRRTTHARGELRLPCDAANVNPVLTLLSGWLAAFGQQIPASRMALWRSTLERELGPAGQTSELRFRFAPQRAGEGLTGKFSYRLTLRPLEDGTVTAATDACGLLQCASLTGDIVVSAVPALVPHSMQLFKRITYALSGGATDGAQLARWRADLERQCKQAFARAAESRVWIRYGSDAGKTRIHSGASRRDESLESRYGEWLEHREGPLFGANPDGKVLQVAERFRRPDAAPVLDVGAGTGRNSLALAKRGFEVDAIDLMPVFVDELNEVARRRGLSVQASVHDMLDENAPLPTNRYQLIVASQVLPHLREVGSFRRFLQRAAEALRRDGLLVCNTFVTDPGYQPDDAVRQIAQSRWCFVVTPDELRNTLAGLPLRLEQEESVCEFEQAHLPAADWPPTRWFESWTSGRNVLPTLTRPPLSLRWLTLRRT